MKLCKACESRDWNESDREWQALYTEIAPEWRTCGPIHRKLWEWTQGLYGLQRLGRIHSRAVALSVGAGHEWPLYWLANRIQRIHAIDLYKGGFVAGDEGNPDMLTAPERFAPFPYRREALVVQAMDGCALEFPDDTFDFVFSFSSIEHFGGHANAQRAVQEMARVLKPGGVAAIATELILNQRPHPEFFLPSEILADLVEPSGMRPVEPVDFSFDDETIKNPVRIDGDPKTWEHISPHIAVQMGQVVFTSVMFFLVKPTRVEEWISKIRRAAGRVRR